MDAELFLITILIIINVIGFLWYQSYERRKQIEYYKAEFRSNQFEYFFTRKSNKQLIEQYVSDLIKYEIVKSIRHKIFDKIYFYTDFEIKDDSTIIYSEWLKLSNLWFQEHNRYYKKYKNYINSAYFNKDDVDFLPIDTSKGWRDKWRILSDFNYKKKIVNRFDKGVAVYLDNVKDKAKIEELLKKIKDYEEQKTELKKEGEEFLKKLRAAPYDNSKVGQSFIRKVSKKKK